MFQGTIPGPMRSIVRETASQWPSGPVYVPCCGNFTIERSVAGMGFALHSSDVSIYTSAVGRWLTRQPVGIQLREESRDVLGWLADSLDDGVGTVATLMLGTRFLASVGREGLWHERVVRSYREQWKVKHAETVERLSGSDIELASYEVEDVRSWLQKVPRDAPVCSFLPSTAAATRSCTSRWRRTSPGTRPSTSRCPPTTWSACSARSRTGRTG